MAGPLEETVVDDDDGELDVAEVLDGDDHVVEHGEVLAVHAEEALEGGERPDGGVGAGGDERGGVAASGCPELGHEGRGEGGERLREADVAPVPDLARQVHGLPLLPQSQDRADKPEIVQGSVEVRTSNKP